MPTPKDPYPAPDLQAFVIFTHDTRSIAVDSKMCACCGGPSGGFRDALSAKEYQISGMCQRCQDETFIAPDIQPEPIPFPPLESELADADLLRQLL